MTWWGARTAGLKAETDINVLVFKNIHFPPVAPTSQSALVLDHIWPYLHKELYFVYFQALCLLHIHGQFRIKNLACMCLVCRKKAQRKPPQAQGKHASSTKKHLLMASRASKSHNWHFALQLMIVKWATSQPLAARVHTLQCQWTQQ